jgi:hypothetical protein
MKKLFLLILILASNVFAEEGWNDIVRVTDIKEPHMTDIFTDSSAIHILIRDYEGQIVYYNLNSEGIVCTTKTCTLETSGNFPNIVGTNDKIYAVYKTVDNKDNDVIRVKYSTDNGDSWETSINDRPTTENDCNGVDAVYNDQGVHLVWATQDEDDPTPAYETYYYRLNTEHSWVDYKNVTDHNSSQTGGNPSVVVSPGRVHVSFNTDKTIFNYGLGDVITRDKYNGNWQDPQTVVSESAPSEQSLDERLLVRGDYLYLFYNCSIADDPNDLKYRTRKADDTQGWSGFTRIETKTLWKYEDAFEVTKTTNDFIHILCKKFQGLDGWEYAYKYYNGSKWNDTNDFDDQGNTGHRQIGLSSVSNDLFCTWVKWETPTRYLHFRQNDAKPLAPQNLTVYKSEDNHPYLSWDKNNEPDLDEYHIYKFVVDWNYLTSTDDNYFEDTDEDYCTAPPPQQCTNEHNISYRITAEDIGTNESDPSNTVIARVLGGPPAKASINALKDEIVTEYSLGQNYPNPFNPSTTISYSIKVNGVVYLKVFDMLGEEVASLVDGRQEAGNYSITFNASNLPSGIYVYRLIANDFTSTKKLIFVK